MTDINDLVQGSEFATSINLNGAVFAMRSSRSLGILQRCFNSLENELEYMVCCDIIFLFQTASAVDLADDNLQTCNDDDDDNRIMRDKFKIVFDQYRKMFDQSLSNSEELGNMLRLLPGVVVQKKLRMQGMADLYRVKPDFLKRFIKRIELLRPSEDGLYPSYTLDDYLSGFLQDRDRSQLHYCDPEFQHISICRQILSLLDQSNVFDDQ